MNKLWKVLFRRRAERILAGMALAILVLGPAAGMSSATVLSGTVTETAISGFAGSPFAVGDANSTTQAVFGLSWEERSGKACLVTVHGENVTDSALQTAAEKDLCGPNGSTSVPSEALYSNADETGEHVFVTGIQICMNPNKNRLKGFRLRSAEVSDHGTVIELRKGGTKPRECSEIRVDAEGTEYRACADDVSLERLDLRSNCDQKSAWMDWAECPPGKVATGLVLHYAAGGEPRGITGIALHCRSVSR